MSAEVILTLVFIQLTNMRMTKRIKITDPKDLKEGMKVEMKYGDGDIESGKLFKASFAPSDSELCLDLGPYSRAAVGLCDPSTHECDGDCIVSIHRLIDGIEDVVVGDVVISNKDLKSIRKVLDVRPGLVIISDPLRSGQANYYGRNATLTFENLEADGWEIYAPEEAEKTELTETEAKELLAEHLGEKPEDIIITKDS